MGGGGCPIDHTANSSAKEGECPVNPDTNLPFASILQSKFFDSKSNGVESLSKERQVSSIPRTDSEEKWKYPSPQMFQQALKRKGYGVDEEKDVESMVMIHNFLNESVWDEVMKWEDMHW